MAIETEIKIKISDRQTLSAQLVREGFVKQRERYFEDNILFDYPTNTLRERGCALRVRTLADSTLLTFKGPAKVNAQFKTREEIEITTSDGASLKLILSRIGLHPVFRYQKYRTEYALGSPSGDHSGPGVVAAMVDETPIGAYLELEGEESAILPLIPRLGYRERDLIKSTYVTIYKCHCEGNGVPFGDMIFP